MNTNDQNTDTKPKNASAPLSNALRYGLVIGAVLLMIMLILGVAGVVRAVGDAFDGKTSPAELAYTLKSESMGKLATVVVHAAKIAVDVRINHGLCEYGAKYYAAIDIEAGIDLGNFSDANITYDEAVQHYQITIPYPELINCEQTPGTDFTRYHDYQSGCGSADRNRNLYPVAGYAAYTEIREDVREIVGDYAEQQTRHVIEQLVKTLTGKSAEVKFADPRPEDQQAKPPSCYPKLPANWAKNDKGNWTPTG